MRVCAPKDKLPLLLLHRIALFKKSRSFQGPGKDCIKAKPLLVRQFKHNGQLRLIKN